MTLKNKSDSRLHLPLLRRRAEDTAGGLPPLLMAAQKAAQSIMTGEHAQRKPGTGEKFWQFREYDPSDRPQDIDWRTSAKGDRVYVRQKEWQTAQIALLWCAAGPDMDYKSAPNLPPKRECALTLALALSILMTRAGERVSALDTGMNPGRSDAALETLGRHLLAQGRATLPPATVKLPRNTGLILAGDFLETPERIEESFSALSRNAAGALIIQVLDPAELSLPFGGRVLFERTGDPAERHHIAHVESVREAYRLRVESHLDAVRSICRRLEWGWILHRTNTPLRETLHEAWMMMAPQRRGGGGGGGGGGA